MNQNRNMLLFVVMSLALLGGYMFLMNRLYPTKPAAPVTQSQQAAPEPAAAPAPPALQPAPAAAQAAEPSSLFTYKAETLGLAWRKRDGALVQATWNADETKFFPEANPAKHFAAFPGIGGAANTTFDGEPELLAVEGGHEVVFHNAAGDRLGYRIPDKGHVLEVNWSSTRGAHLCLIRSLNELPKEQGGGSEAVEVNPFHNLDRLFTIQDKGIESVKWMDTLKDPFFSFLGAKRKVLPPTSNRVGMDAGIAQGEDAQRSHYFAAIWDASAVAIRDTATLPGYHLAPDSAGKASARLYLGPKKEDELMKFHAPGHPEQGKPFLKVVDYGFFGLIAQLLFLILKLVHSVIPNWGWAIVVFTLIIRALLWPLNNKTTISMVRMKELEPHQKALQAKYEKFGNDMAKKQEMQKELMAFYKKNGHNPMGGCLPMLVQMPVFFALWSMLNAVYELRGTSFLWLKDLSQADVLFRLPVMGFPLGILSLLLGASMVVQQLMTPAMGDPAQRKMMLFLMPAMMMFFFAATPAGLCLYYLMFNLVGIVQTWWVMKNYQPQPVKL